RPPAVRSPACDGRLAASCDRAGEPLSGPSRRHRQKSHRLITDFAQWVDRPVRQGASVTTTSAPRPSSLLRSDGTPVRVLVVDDEPNLADLLTMALRYEGWEIRTAHDGLSAVRLAREFKPDAVVLDVMLPDLNGLEVLRRLRDDAPNLPVLFLTAKDAVEDRIAGLTAGGDDYVTKPFSLEEVVARCAD